VCKKLEARFGKKALEAKKMKRAATSARWTFDKEDEERQQSTANPAQGVLYTGLPNVNGSHCIQWPSR